jgi:vacuolar-type H+-ATPase subunit E/Vma4
MEEARAEGNAIIESYREALQKVFDDHKKEAINQSETQVKAETLNAKQQFNRSLSKSQVELKRRHGKIQQELKDKIFEEANNLLQEFMASEAYEDFLIRCIRKAMAFAPDESVTIYLNSSDEARRSDLEDATGAHLTISEEDFVGGIRAIIRSRNILIDHSFKTSLINEYDKFLFQGGDILD